MGSLNSQNFFRLFDGTSLLLRTHELPCGHANLIVPLISKHWGRLAEVTISCRWLWRFSRAAHTRSCPEAALLEPHIPTGSHFSLPTYRRPSSGLNPGHSAATEARPPLTAAQMGDALFVRHTLVPCDKMKPWGHREVNRL